MNAQPKKQEIAMRDDVPPAVTNPVSIMDVIARAASDPNTDVTKLERLMQMAQGIEAKHAEQAFHAAMGEAQAEMRPIAADATNPSTKSKYASLAALDRALRPIYTKHGFALSYDTGDGAPENYVRVVCHVSHRAGYSRAYHIDMPADGKGAKGGDVMTKTHAVGSAMSYGARYLLKMIFNVSVGDADDDGNAAGGSHETITEEQVSELRGLIEAREADIEKFCQYFKIAALPDLPAKDFNRAMAALKRPRK